MNLAEYSTALKALPMNYKVLQVSDVSVVEFGGTLFLCHKDNGPIYFNKKEWCEVVSSEYSIHG